MTDIITVTPSVTTDEEQRMYEICLPKIRRERTDDVWSVVFLATFTSRDAFDAALRGEVEPKVRSFTFERFFRMFDLSEIGVNDPKLSLVEQIAFAIALSGAKPCAAQCQQCADCVRIEFASFRVYAAPKPE
jgi:hypothetical protein